MDTKTKIFWWTMGIIILASFGATFYRYMIKKDYIVQAQVDCDPYTEACFVWECDPESEEEGEKCTGDPEEDIWYYKIVNKNASKISSCDVNDENCDALACAQNELDCEFVFCTSENMEENYASACVDPAQYALENPIDEEKGECEEGDEECLSSEEKEMGDVGVEEIAGENLGEGEEEIESEANNKSVDESRGSQEEVEGAEGEEDESQEVTVGDKNSEVSPEEKVVQNNEESRGSLPILE